MAGAAEGALRDLRDRIHSELYAAGYAFPHGRITVNLAPADLPKRGARFDLPVALALLQAQGVGLPPASNCEFVGELSLDGAPSLRPVAGALPRLRLRRRPTAYSYYLRVMAPRWDSFPRPRGVRPPYSAVLAWR